MIIRIIEMKGEPQYNNKVGKVTLVDDIGQIHGTWGGCALVPGYDKFEEVKDVYEELLEKWCTRYGYKTEHPYNDEFTTFYDKQGNFAGSINPSGHSDLCNVTRLCNIFKKELE